MANKSNPATQIISTPQGGGALHGIGETFSPHLHTGTGNFTVPIALPSGRNGFQPQRESRLLHWQRQRPVRVGLDPEYPRRKPEDFQGDPAVRGRPRCLLAFWRRRFGACREGGGSDTLSPANGNLFVRIEHRWRCVSWSRSSRVMVWVCSTRRSTFGAAGVLGQSLWGQAAAARSSTRLTAIWCCRCRTGDSPVGDGPVRAAHPQLAGAPTDGDGDGWRWGYEQTVRYQGLGAPAQPRAGATAIRADGDGHETVYTWDAARAAFLGTDGSGAHDELRYDTRVRRVGVDRWVRPGDRAVLGLHRPSSMTGG